MSKVVVFAGEGDELLSDPVFAGVDGADGGLHDLGDGLKREFIADVQMKELLVGGREELDEGRKRVTLLLAQEAIGGCGLTIDELVTKGSRGVGVGVKADGGALVAEKVDRVVIGDDFEPVTQLAAARVLGELSKIIADEASEEIGLKIKEIVFTGTMAVNAQRVLNGEEHRRFITLKQLHPPSAISLNTSSHETPVIVITSRDVIRDRDKCQFTVLFAHHAHPLAEPRPH